MGTEKYQQNGLENGIPEQKGCLVVNPIELAIKDPLGAITNPYLREEAYQKAVVIMWEQWAKCGVLGTDVAKQQKLHKQKEMEEKGGIAFALQTIDLAYQLTTDPEQRNGNYASFQAVLEGVGDFIDPVDPNKIDLEAFQQRFEFIKKQDGLPVESKINSQ